MKHPDLLFQHHMKHLQHTSKTSETLTSAICAFSATSPCCLGMEACRRVEFTGVEFVGGAARSSLLRWRKLRRVYALENPRRAGGTVEREEDGLPCSSAKEMSAGRAVARWRGRHCGDWGGKRDGKRHHRGGMAERDRGELSRCYGEVSFFLFLDRTVGASG
jgi:hypothetical protein